MRDWGYYWVRYEGEWTVAYYGALGWMWFEMEYNGYNNPYNLLEDKDVPFESVGVRIPYPED